MQTPVGMHKYLKKNHYIISCENEKNIQEIAQEDHKREKDPEWRNIKMKMMNEKRNNSGKH